MLAASGLRLINLHNTLYGRARTLKDNLIFNVGKQEWLDGEFLFNAFTDTFLIRTKALFLFTSVRPTKKKSVTYVKKLNDVLTCTKQVKYMTTIQAHTIVLMAGTSSFLVRETSENAMAPRNPPYAMTNWST